MARPDEPLHSAEPLYQALTGKVLPLLRHGIAARLAMATPAVQDLELPAGMEAIRMRRTGQRVPSKNSRSMHRASYQSAEWPQDHLHELRVPKLAFAVQGKAGIAVGDYVLRCPENYGIFMPPGTAHPDGTRPHLDTLPPENIRCDVLWIAPFADGVNCWICHSHGSEHISAGHGERAYLPNGQLVQYMYAFSEEAVDADGGDVAILESLMSTLLHSMARDIRRGRFLVLGASTEVAWIGGDAITRAEHYIRSHLSMPIALDDVARHAAMSRAQFTRKFREKTGQSFLEYTNALRLERARVLLKETEWPVTMVAKFTGFGCVEHFHRLFAKEAQVSPLEFRRQSRNEKT